LKLINPEIAHDPAFARRFDEESAILKEHNSSHQVTILDHGESNRFTYLATRYVTGRDLASYLQERTTLPIPEALDIFGQVVDGLGQAHSVGVLHRDLKPSNVLLRRGPERVYAYLRDFGMTRDHVTPAGTHLGLLTGSLAYLAPECQVGRPASVQSDLYAAGCLLWAMVSGQTPFVGTEFQIAMGHWSGTLPQLDAQDGDAEFTNRMLAWCLAKAPSDRPVDAAALLAELGGRDTAPKARARKPIAKAAPAEVAEPRTAKKPVAKAPAQAAGQPAPKPPETKKPATEAAATGAPAARPRAVKKPATEAAAQAPGQQAPKPRETKKPAKGAAATTDPQGLEAHETEEAPAGTSAAPADLQALEPHETEAAPAGASAPTADRQTTDAKESAAGTPTAAVDLQAPGLHEAEEPAGDPQAPEPHDTEEAATGTPAATAVLAAAEPRGAQETAADIAPVSAELTSGPEPTAVDDSAPPVVGPEFAAKVLLPSTDEWGIVASVLGVPGETLAAAELARTPDTAPVVSPKVKRRRHRLVAALVILVLVIAGGFVLAPKAMALRPAISVNNTLISYGTVEQLAAGIVAADAQAGIPLEQATAVRQAAQGLAVGSLLAIAPAKADSVVPLSQIDELTRPDPYLTDPAQQAQSERTAASIRAIIALPNGRTWLRGNLALEAPSNSLAAVALREIAQSRDVWVDPSFGYWDQKDARFTDSPPSQG